MSHHRDMCSNIHQTRTSSRRRKTKLEGTHIVQGSLGPNTPPNALPFPSLSLFCCQAMHPSVDEATILQALHWALVLFPKVNSLHESALPYLC